MRQTGTYQILGDLKYFIPHALPPANPALILNNEILFLYGEASFALGQLNEMSLRLPDPKRFINAYVIKEALLSSAIENIHTTLADIFTHDTENKSTKNTRLVLNYVKALDTALTMLQIKGLPLATRVILQAHAQLMTAGSAQANPGHFRQQSVRVGSLVPPPAIAIAQLMADLEKYINEPSDMPPLIKAGLVHIQFETIHPFLDGNGRIGRLLIVLMMIDSKILHLPILYPSYYFKKHHLEYYHRLNQVRQEGDFEGWIIYYLKAIRDSAIDAHRRAKEIEQLEFRLEDIIENDANFNKMRPTVTAVIRFLFSKPIANITEISRAIDKAYNTIQNILKRLVKLDIVSTTVTYRRHKLYRFEPYLILLDKNYD